MKYQKGDLVKFQKGVRHSHKQLPYPIMIIAGIVILPYYDQCYKYRFLHSDREEVCSKANFENITEMIG